MNTRKNKGGRREDVPYTSKVSRQSSSRRRRRLARRIVLAVIVVLILAAFALFLWGIFGRVEVGSDDVSRDPSGTAPQTSGSSATTGSSSTTTGGSADTTPPATTTSTTSTTTAPTVPDPVSAKTYLQPSGAAWNLILVNDYNAVPDGYEQNTTMEWVSGGQMDTRAADAYRQMLADGAAYDIRGVSLFRPQSLQESLFSREVEKWKGQGYDQEAAEQKANTIVKRPGYSEHNTGLAADVGGSGNYSLNQDFENTDAYRWLIEHCADYGFILRFPKDKEEITGVIFEPWHYRYVGVEAAQEIMSRDLCLEEYQYEKVL